MAEQYCTASSVVLEDVSKSYTPVVNHFPQKNYLVTPVARKQFVPEKIVTEQIAEESGDYCPKAVSDEAFTTVLQDIEIRSHRGTAAAQIGRLLRLADVLDTPVAVPRSAELLSQFATELRQATDKLEDALHAIVDQVLINSKDV